MKMNINNDSLIGEANSFLEVLEHVSWLAPINKPVIITGERGTGKELIAHRLHYLSGRWQNPFISLNCSALNENLLDSELFGHEAGSFTGAQKRHQGRFERADKGTLFLDEIATAPKLVQEKLLRVIEYGELERVGGNKSIHVNVRLICATNQDLPSLADEGKFRADLLDRLAFDVINLPPLRQRQQDIMLLANHFAIQVSRELGHPLFPGFTRKAELQLTNYYWPGNIRELKNVVERSVYRHGSIKKPLDNIIINPFKNSDEVSNTGSSELSTKLISDSSLQLPINLKQWLAEQEHSFIQQALQHAHFNHQKAAELLGLTYHQLRGMMRKQSK